MALIPKGGNDVVYTPDLLAYQIVQTLNPEGVVLEPCRGSGAFIRAFEKQGVLYDWCEISEGRNFF